ncbi:protein IRREGULAR XYLEM 15-like [Eucalyptus grandis]|uniref:protein IRREGULAR XYLEM 15-like n=1 Tax=Eucalyptus grandis TaxID=71139 RepID=UPI00192EF2E6|nr:protein IRREGULAR XYLEM 15-like [Eucalyptus grandis]
MKNVNNSNTRLILVQKQGSSNRLWLLAFISFLTTAFVVTLICTREYSTTAASATTPTFPSAATAYSNAPLPSTVINTLLHYASKSSDSFRMSFPELKPMSDVLWKCSSPCDFLGVGLTRETLLRKAHNHHSQAKYRIDEFHHTIR